jgi:hypothetical protein
MALFFSFPPTRLLFDAGDEPFPMVISTFSGRTDRPSRPTKAERHFFDSGLPQKKFSPLSSQPMDGFKRSRNKPTIVIRTMSIRSTNDRRSAEKWTRHSP